VTQALFEKLSEISGAVDVQIAEDTQDFILRITFDDYIESLRCKTQFEISEARMLVGRFGRLQEAKRRLILQEVAQ
jgi:hypothetical protein